MVISKYSFFFYKINGYFIHCFYFTVTRSQRNLCNLLDAANIAHSKPTILIQRNTRYELLIIKRKRIVERRFTVATEVIEEPNDPPSPSINEAVTEATVDPMPIASNEPQPSSIRGRSILFLGKANKSGFRTISNRRQSAPPSAYLHWSTPPFAKLCCTKSLRWPNLQSNERLQPSYSVRRRQFWSNWIKTDKNQTMLIITIIFIDFYYSNKKWFDKFGIFLNFAKKLVWIDQCYN